MDRPDFKSCIQKKGYGLPYDTVHLEDVEKAFDEWLSQQTKLYGLKDEDGWHFHEKPGDFDTHRCRFIDLQAKE